MAEILGVVAGASQLLGQSIDLICRIQNAREASKNHDDDMSRYLSLIKQTKGGLDAIQELMNKIDALKSDQVRECAKSIKEESQGLEDLLKTISDKKSSFHKFIHGKSETEKLKSKIDAVRGAEAHLQDALLRVLIGLTWSGFQAKVDKKLVLETNAEVQEILGTEHELSIVKAVKDKITDENGNVILDQEELDRVLEATEGTKRVIRNNSTRQQALQFNAPIGSDLWKDVAQIDIHDNTAEDQSRQFNYAQTMDVYHDQMARIPKPLDYRFLAVLVAAVAVLYIVYGK